MKRIILALSLACSTSIAIATPMTFEHAVNLHDSNYADYLHSTTNAKVYRESGSWPAKYWSPTSTNTWGEVVYRYPVGFPIHSASIDTIGVVTFTPPLVNFDPAAEAYLDVSPDGQNWTNLYATIPGQVAIAGRGVTDITEHVLGSSEIWVRARLLATRHPIYSQFMRVGPTAETESVANGGRAGLGVFATAIPEPTSFALLASACSAIVICRRS